MAIPLKNYNIPAVGKPVEVGLIPDALQAVFDGYSDRNLREKAVCDTLLMLQDPVYDIRRELVRRWSEKVRPGKNCGSFYIETFLKKSTSIASFFFEHGIYWSWYFGK